MTLKCAQSTSSNISFRSIQSKLILLLSILLVPTLLIQAYIYHDSFRTSRSEELQANLEVARAVAKAFDAWLQNVLDNELLIGAALLSSHPPIPEDRGRLFAMAMMTTPTIRYLSFMNPSGAIIASSNSDSTEEDVTECSRLGEILAGKDFTISNLVFSKHRGLPYFTISRGIRDEYGNLHGIIVAEIAPDKLRDVLGIKRSHDAGVSILDSEGMLVCRFPGTDYTWEQRNWRAHHRVIDDVLKGKEMCVLTTSISSGKPRLAAFTPVSSIGWVAAASRAEEDVLAEASSKILTHGSMYFLVTVIAFALALFFACKITCSMAHIRDYALALGRGEDTRPLPRSGMEELDDLADAFDEMFHNIRLRERDRQQAEQALRESEQRFEAFMDKSPAIAWMKDEAGRYVYLNAAAEARLGMTLEEVFGKDDFAVFPTERAQKFRENDRVVLENDCITNEVDEFIPTDGPPDTWWKLRFPLRDAAGNKYVGGIGLNITERRQMEEELFRSTQDYRLLFETMEAGVVYRDAEGKIIKVNPAAERIVGRSREEILGGMSASLEDFSVHEDGSPWPDSGHPSRIALRTGRDVEGAVMGVFNQRENAYRWITIKAVPLFREGEPRPYEVYTIFNDVTEQKTLEQDLRNSHRDLERRVQERTVELERVNEELRSVPSRLIAAQEEERRRIGGELHDSIGQTLAALKFWVEMILNLRDEVRADTAMARLEQFIPILQRSIEETRNIYMGLHPGMLDNVGLLATLEWLRRESMELYPERHIELETDIEEQQIPENLKTSMFRIAQEALNNIAKHSMAEWVDLSLLRTDGGIQLSIVDDGIGFDQEAIWSQVYARSLGLTGMKERAEIVGGTFSVASKPGEGTKISATWPFDHMKHPAAS